MANTKENKIIVMYYLPLANIIYYSISISQFIIMFTQLF